MKSLFIYGVLLSTVGWPLRANAQFKKQETKSVSILALPKECRESVEMAVNQKNTAKIIWGETDSQLTFVPFKMSEDALMKKMALAGYDNALYLAPDDTYAALPKACQYPRGKRPMTDHGGHHQPKNDVHANHQHALNTVQKATSFDGVMETYMQLKNALIKADFTTANHSAMALQTALKGVDWSIEKSALQQQWKGKEGDILNQLQALISAKTIDKQRSILGPLSNNLYPFIQQMPLSKTVYFQACPMYNDGKEANWFSHEQAVKNPFYGSQMLSCGSTIETLQK